MTTASPLSSLRRRLAATVLGGVAVLGVASLAVTETLGRGASYRWVLVTGAVLAGVFSFVYRHLDANRVSGSLRHRLGLANGITVVRGGLVACVAGFVVLPRSGAIAWLPAMGYGTAVLLDLVDGWVARQYDDVTDLGRRLDEAVDVLGLLVAPVLAVSWGWLPVWYLTQSVAWFLFVAGKRFRQHRGLPVHSLPASRVRRPLAALQMTFVTVALVPLAPRDTVAVGAAVVLLPSLLGFVRDYLAVAGVRPTKQ